MYCFAHGYRFILFCFAFLFFSCNHPSPVGDDQTNSTQIVDVTIGQQGDTLSLDNFIFQIPRGSFATPAKVSVFYSAQNAQFESQYQGGTYKIKGLPSSFSDTLRIKIRSEKADSGISFAVGEVNFIKSWNDTLMTYTMKNAVNEPQSWYSLPLFVLPGSSPEYHPQADTMPVITVSLIWGTSNLITAGGHFSITFPTKKVTGAQALTLGNNLEEAFSACTSLDFRYTARTVWPVLVSVINLPEGRYGAFVSSGNGVNNNFLEFSQDSLNNATEITATAGHEFLHFAQYFYDPRPLKEKSSSGGPCWFIDEATAVWSEQLYIPSNNYISSARKGNELNPLNGPAHFDVIGHEACGYGLSSMIRYAASQQGSSFIIKTYENILAGQAPFIALQGSLTSPFSQWWPAYMQELVTNKIYGDITSKMLEENRSGMFAVRTAADTQAVFSAAYRDLSARLYLIRLQNPDLDSSASLKISVPHQNTRIYAYGYEKDSAVFSLGFSSDSLLVTGLIDIQARSANILVLVINAAATMPNLTAQNTITTSMRIVKTFNIKKCTMASFSLTYKATWQDGAVVPKQDLNFSSRKGSFFGNSYTEVWDSTSSDSMHYTGHFTATFDLASLDVLSWDLANKWIYPMPNTYNEYICAGTNRLKSMSQSDNSIRYYILGSSACKGLSSLQVKQVSNGTVSKELKQFDADTTSVISFSFYK